MAFLVKTAEQLLASSSKQGRLAHAYLITGPEHSGKRQLTLRIMNLVSGHDCSSIEQAAGEYVQIVRPEFMRRMKEMQMLQGMDTSMFPDMYNVIVNANNPIVKEQILSKEDEGERAENATHLYQLALLSQQLLSGADLKAFVDRSVKMMG